MFTDQNRSILLLVVVLLALGGAIYFLSPASSDETNESMELAFNVEVTYVDGTTKIIDGRTGKVKNRDGSFSKIRFPWFSSKSIVDLEGDQIFSITYKIEVKYDWTPTSVSAISDLDWTGTYATILIDDAVKRTMSLDLPTAVNRNTWYTIGQTTVTDDNLESWTIIGGPYEVECFISLDLTMAVAGYDIEPISHAGTALVGFNHLKDAIVVTGYVYVIIEGPL